MNIIVDTVLRPATVMRVLAFGGLALWASSCDNEIEVPDDLPGSIEERPSLTPDSPDGTPSDSVPDVVPPVDAIDDGEIFGLRNDDGVMLYYRPLSDQTCAVVRGDDTLPDYEPYQGDVAIPAMVEHDGRRLTVTAVAERAFERSTVTALQLPSTLTSIGGYAFQYSTLLQQLTIPGGVQRFDACICRGCTGLKSVTLLDGVINIGKMAFYGCVQLADVQLPHSLGVIDVGAFQGCKALTEVEIPPYVGVINDYAFSKTGITSFVYPDKITQVSESVFQNCASLTSVHLPASLTRISNYAFAGCKSIEYIELPEGVTEIGSLAFTGCTSLHTLRALPPLPPVCSDDSFDPVSSSPGSSLRLQVPAGSIQTYQSAPVWQRFEIASY